MLSPLKITAVAATALSLIAGSAVAQPHSANDRHDNHGNDRQVSRKQDNGHHYARGQRLPENYRSSRYAVDYRKQKLRAPPRGYRWQRVDNDYILAAVATGLIAEIISAR